MEHIEDALPVACSAIGISSVAGKLLLIVASLYESEAHWENFVIRALAYVSGQSEKAVREMKSPDREDQLWPILDQQPFLLVLDGLNYSASKTTRKLLKKFAPSGTMFIRTAQRQPRGT